MATALSNEVRRRAPEARPPGRRRTVGRNLWWFVIPGLVLYLYVVVLPTAQGIYLSFTNWSAFTTSQRFVGTRNYESIFEGASAEILVRTLIIAAATMVIQNVLGLLLALTLNTRVFARNVLRTLIFAPVIVSPLVCGYLFKYLFAPPGIGAVNDLLDALGLGRLQQDWLGQPDTALTVVIMVVCWQFVGMSMVIYLAGLQGVPAELLEAASLDGAGAVRRFWYVIRPLLAPAFMINMMMSLIGGLKIFDQIYSTTQGGPAGQTETISTTIYRLFSMQGDYAASTALAVALALIVAVLSLVQFSILRRQKGTS
ncbi:carbohydrate ABC transporter permease [Nonomuraea angiospora]|uniref:carbohydrate ABC transporter permease n=1 Tax=Nonomuraea angiospora TaxID=46172 RepID=UPI0029B6A0C6|nr:sugar ABC transporter permease [Nonomuraea angiospora]MDX3104119.1 sugar ABC transporter permease [Nonomuraea angiospora]